MRAGTAPVELGRAPTPASGSAGPLLRVPLGHALDARQAGGKASSLSKLIGLGFPVPAGHVLTCEAFRRFLAAEGLGARIAALERRLDPLDPSRRREVSAAVRAQVEGGSLPVGVAEALEAAARELPAGARLAVRSSAVGEDGAAASFAGQFDSVLHVTPGDGLRRAVRACWASYWSERSLYYRAARDAVLGGMAVVLQRQVSARVSGVLFTRAPAGASGAAAAPVGAGDALVIECCPGLADRLVSGHVDPLRLVVPRAGRTPSAGTLLTAADVRSLTAVALRLERELGAPQDVEWSIDDDGRLWILQARPITTAHEAPRTATAGVANAATDEAPRAAAHETPRAAACEVPRSAAREEARAAVDKAPRAANAGAPRTATAGAPNAPQDKAPRASRAPVLWSNANVNENFPAPISPLLYSFAASGYYHYFRNLGLAFGISRRRLAAMDPALRAIVGVHGGRLYYNLTNIHAVLRMAPCGERLARAFNQFVGADEIAPPPAGAARWGQGRGRVGQAFELLRVAARTTWQYLFLRRRLEAFEDRADRFAARTHPEQLEGRPLPGLLEDLRSFLDIRFHRWKDASLADAAAMVSYALLQRALRGVDTRGGLHNRLLRALPGVPSAVPPLRLWALSRLIRSDARLDRLFAGAATPTILDALRHDDRFVGFRRELDRFLDDWGFRSSAELMLTVPSLREEPAPVIELLRQYAASDAEPPESAMARQAAERVQETSDVVRTLARRSPVAALRVWLLLRAAQASVAYRERARLKQALLYTRLRRVALAIGRRLADAGRLVRPDDVFMLTWQEIEELGTGRAMFPYRVPDLVALRRREHAALAAMQPPATVTVPLGEYLPPGLRGDRGDRADRNDLNDLVDRGDLNDRVDRGDRVDRADRGKPAGRSATVDRPGEQTPVRSTLRGTGASGGTAAGPAAVLGDVRDAARLRGGDVLVTRQTDPGWAPVFGLVSGLVIERGGLLSHGAIVAREFGLPCVVGVENATGRIRPGQHVTVDGDRGVCTIDPIDRETDESAVGPAAERGAA